MASAAERFFRDRHVDPRAVKVPAGFRVEVAATGLNSPSCIEFDEEGNIFVSEIASPDGATHGRVVRVRPDGSSAVVSDDFRGPVTGILFYEGSFYVIEHGAAGRIFWLKEDGTRDLVFIGIPGGGDHSTSDIVLAHSERLYFGQGTRTNSGVMGPDNFGRLEAHPGLHDAPGADITLTGRNFQSPTPSGEGMATTGAFKPFGTPSHPGEVVRGDPRATGSIMRISPDDGEFELFAWGLRNPVGLCVHQDGRVFCTDRGMQERGSRPVAGGREYIWQVVEGGWYGWPDYEGGEPVTNARFTPAGGEKPEFLLESHPELAGAPAVYIPAGSGAAGFDFSRSPWFGTPDTAFLACTGADPGSDAGFKVVMADVGTGDVTDFAVNSHPGPASRFRSGGMERPFSVRFDRTGESIYVLDLGIAMEDGRSIPGTGVVWRIAPDEIV